MTEQTKSKPQQTPEIKFNKQMKTFSFSSPINLPEEGNCSLEVTSFEATNTVLTINNRTFAISIPGHWSSWGDAEAITRQHNLLKLRSQKDFELLVKKVRKRAYYL